MKNVVTTYHIDTLVEEIDYKEYATELWKRLEIGPLAQVPSEHGEYVLYVLKHLDHLANVINIRGKWERRNIKPPKSIGGYLANKIFKYEIDATNKVYYIWRIQ